MHSQESDDFQRNCQTFSHTNDHRAEQCMRQYTDNLFYLAVAVQLPMDNLTIRDNFKRAGYANGKGEMVSIGSSMDWRELYDIKRLFGAQPNDKKCNGESL